MKVNDGTPDDKHPPQVVAKEVIASTRYLIRSFSRLLASLLLKLLTSPVNSSTSNVLLIILDFDFS